MDEELHGRVAAEAEKHALYNALKHGGDPEVDAILGPLMGENPAFREHGGEVAGVVADVVADVSRLDASERRDRLAELAPDMLEELEAAAASDDRPLPELPNADEYDRIRMRLAPNPNGPWHIGNARMPSVIGTYKRMYDGWMLCRFDDTDPETKRPALAAYDAILADLEYLGFEPDEVIRASDRLETYYGHARELIDAGGAYTCSCPASHFRELKADGDPCDHRDKDPETSHEEFGAMVDGEHDPGEMVLRVRTDIDHPNPALRDWVAFRMIDTPHPRPEAADYRCWPMLDFQSGIDDHLTGITHIVRGIDLQDSAKRQRFLYDYFGWEYPEVIHWGHVQVDEYDVEMSTSTIRELVEAGELTGWDDPRAPTLRSLRRRGIRGGAIVGAMTGLGMSTSDVDLSMSAVYANNRELVDDEADRFFLVRDTDREPAVERAVVGGPDAGHPPVHPDHEDRGERTVPASGGVLLEGADLPDHGERVWLKGYGCVRHVRDAFQYVGDDVGMIHEADVPVVHWVPAEPDRRLEVRVRTVGGDLDGHAEPAFADAAVDEVVQFERVGFARVDARDPTDPGVDRVVYYSHP